jgi:hypothetical protein
LSSQVADGPAPALDKAPAPTMNNADGKDVANDAKELLGLCRAGRLYEIEKWIADGKSLDISQATKRGRQRSRLEIAIETGFHSLVELIAKHETPNQRKTRR